MWLARYVEHTVDVDAMLNRMEPWQFQEWALMVKIWNPESEPNDGDKPSALSAMRSLAGV